jgi:5,10-methylenetetrahydrofolate reductase
MIDRIKNAENKAAESIAITAELIRGLKPYCQGIHFMTLGWERHIRAVLSQVNESMSQ